MKKTPTLVNDFRTMAKLRQIAEGMSSDPSERDDLLQEALIHLWVTQLQRPGQTTSWYVQSCRFHLRHYLARGRSVDSKKRSANRADLFATDEPVSFDVPAIEGQNDCEVQATINDDIRVLSDQLTSSDKRMLEYLLDGLTLREAASKLEISFPTALKRRRRIGEIFKRLQNPPLLKVQVFRSSDGNQSDGNQSHSLVLRIQRVHAAPRRR